MMTFDYRQLEIDTKNIRDFAWEEEVRYWVRQIEKNQRLVDEAWDTFPNARCTNDAINWLAENFAEDSLEEQFEANQWDEYDAY